MFCRFCWNDSVCSPFPSPSTQLFFQSLPSHTLCSRRERFSTVITSPLSDAANSNMSAPMRFAGGTTYLRKKGIAFLPITCAGAPNPLPSVFQPLYSMESLLVLKQPSCSIVRIRNECWTPFEISKQVE